MNREEFLRWIKSRLAGGQTKADLGRQLGVTGQAIRRWLEEGSPAGVSDTVLLLASRICDEEKSSVEWARW